MHLGGKLATLEPNTSSARRRIQSSNVSYALTCGAAVILWTCVFLVACVTCAIAQPADLDPTFDFDGKVTTSFTRGDTRGRAVAIQANGRMIVAGSALYGSTDRFALIRYGVDGQLDSSFGGHGWVTTEVPDGDSWGVDLALQDDAKIVVAGDSDSGITIARYNPDGTIDGSFGASGIATTSMTEAAYANGMAIDEDGRIIVVATIERGVGEYDNSIALLRFNANGTPDSTFGSSGTVITNAAPGLVEEASNVSVQGDGKLLVVGTAVNEWPHTWSTGDILAMRFEPDGSLDASFGNGGVAITDLIPGSDDWAMNAIVDSGGRIVVAASTNADERWEIPVSLAVIRFAADGALDPTFDTDGWAVTEFGGGLGGGAADVAVQANGRIVVAGGVYNEDGFLDVGVARYLENGELDVTFSGDGKTTARVDGYWDSEASALAVNDGGDVVVGGTAYYDYDDYSGFGDVVVFRFAPGGESDSSFSDDGNVVTQIGSFPEVGRALAVQADGKLIVGAEGFDAIRYNTDGSLDQTFGTNGIADGSASWTATAQAVSIQADGKVIVVGVDCYVTASVRVVRYTAEGAPDDTYGDSGSVTKAVGGCTGAADSDVALQDDGKAVVVTTAYTGASTGSDCIISRFRVDGSIDGTFADGGVLVSDLGTPYDECNAVAVQGDGRIIVAGKYSNHDTGSSGMVVARYAVDGRLDLSFGSGGIVTVEDGGEPEDMALQADGKIIVAGQWRGANLFLARFTGEGVLDGTFGVNGLSRTTLVGRVADGKAVAIQPDGKILLVGHSHTLLVARYGANGTLDSDFGGTGIVETDVGPDGGNGYDIGIQGDGKIVAVGTAVDATDTDVAIVRYQGTQISDPDLDRDGARDGVDLCPYTIVNVGVDDDGCSCGQKSCSDGDPCTTDSCESLTAECINEPISEGCTPGSTTTSTTTTAPILSTTSTTGTTITTTTVPTTELVVDGIEVVQSIQYQGTNRTPIVLVAGKRTAVRVYVRAIGGAPLYGVRAQLALLRHTVNGDVQAVLSSINNAVVRAEPQRANIDDSFLFVLPPEWTHAQVDMRATVATPDGQGEVYADIEVVFKEHRPLNVKLYQVAYWHDGDVVVPRVADSVGISSWLKRAYPVPAANVEVRTLLRDEFPRDEETLFGTSLGCLKVNRELRGLRAAEQIENGAGFDPDARYYGLVYDDDQRFMRGCADLSGRVGSGPTGRPERYREFQWDTDGTYGDWYAGHEIGHTFGFRHIGECPEGQGNAASCRCDWIGESPECCQAFDNPDGLIGPSDGSAYGFDMGRPGGSGGYAPPTAVMSPDEWTDMMTYCSKQWISDITYSALSAALAVATPEEAEQRKKAFIESAEPLLLIEAVVMPTESTGEIEEVARIDSADAASIAEPSEYYVRLFDREENLILDVPLRPRYVISEAQDELSNPTDAPIPVGIIQARVPFVVGTHRVSLWHDNEELDARIVSDATPGVTFVAGPAAGETVDSDTVLQWEMHDADSDPLVATVSYSRDGGVTWQAIKTGITDTTYHAVTSSLPGGETCLFKVRVSDGVNESQALSAVFVVPDKEPVVVIEAPKDGAVVRPTQALALLAQVTDPEDGSLDGDAVSWNSDVQGELGRGVDLVLSGAALTVGHHVVTVTAVDSGSNVVTASLRVAACSAVTPSGQCRASSCGDVNLDAAFTATDALAALGAAIRVRECASCVCDATGNGEISATDALAVLRVAVGLGDGLMCPEC